MQWEIQSQNCFHLTLCFTLLAFLMLIWFLEVLKFIEAYRKISQQISPLKYLQFHWFARIQKLCPLLIPVCLTESPHPFLLTPLFNCSLIIINPFNSFLLSHLSKWKENFDLNFPLHFHLDIFPSTLVWNRFLKSPWFSNTPFQFWLLDRYGYLHK